MSPSYILETLATIQALHRRAHSGSIFTWDKFKDKVTNRPKLLHVASYFYNNLQVETSQSRKQLTYPLQWNSGFAVDLGEGPSLANNVETVEINTY